MLVNYQVNYSPLLNFPEELRFHIFSSLTNKELQTARKVCSQWNASVIVMVLKREWTLLLNIIKHIQIPLPVPFETSTLTEIPKILTLFRKEAIHYLSQVSKSDLQKLDADFASQRMPLYCKNLFFLGLIEAKTQEARNLKGLNRNLHLSGLCRNLLCRGELSTAVEIAGMISNLLIKGVVMEEITLSMLSKKQPERAYRIADSIPHLDHKRKALKAVAIYYDKIGDNSKAYAVRDSIPKEEKEDLLDYYDRIHSVASIPPKKLRKIEQLQE